CSRAPLESSGSLDVW
nr:immunoglobulin heavy chain junction region [Macaca mulatta]MOV88478.1 immunoglobulin heavy chain junction region [Macaca mulatta]MOV90314.1 immunoglobulin heavy chain junction region [Macaca mulatta]